MCISCMMQHTYTLVALVEITFVLSNIAPYAQGQHQLHLELGNPGSPLRPKLGSFQNFGDLALLVSLPFHSSCSSSCCLLLSHHLHRPDDARRTLISKCVSDSHCRVDIIELKWDILGLRRVDQYDSLMAVFAPG